MLAWVFGVVCFFLGGGGDLVKYLTPFYSSGCTFVHTLLSVNLHKPSCEERMIILILQKRKLRLREGE